MTKAALLKSIEHWKENVAADYPELVSLSVRDCALCQLYFKLPNYGDCDSRCPVVQKTKMPHCKGTSYLECAGFLAQWEDAPESTSARNHWRNAAGNMLKELETIYAEMPNE